MSCSCACRGCRQNRAIPNPRAPRRALPWLHLNRLRAGAVHPLALCPPAGHGICDVSTYPRPTLTLPRNQHPQRKEASCPVPDAHEIWRGARVRVARVCAPSGGRALREQSRGCSSRDASPHGQPRPSHATRPSRRAPSPLRTLYHQSRVQSPRARTSDSARCSVESEDRTCVRVLVGDEEPLATLVELEVARRLAARVEDASEREHARGRRIPVDAVHGD